MKGGESVEISEHKAITITMSMEEAYKLEGELRVMGFDDINDLDHKYPLMDKLYYLLPEKED